MGLPCVQRVTEKEIDSLVKRLEAYGPQTAKMRCFLMLLRSGVNSDEHWVYATEDEPGRPLLALVITLSAADLLVVDAFAENDPVSHECLGAALSSPSVSARLWESGQTWRADCWPTHLQPVLERAARQRGFSVTLLGPVRHMFVREVGPDDENDEQWQKLRAPAGGVVVRPLRLSHLAKVKKHWPYLQRILDADAILRRSVETGLSAGVFLLSSEDSKNSMDFGDSVGSSDSRESNDAGNSVKSMNSGESGKSMNSVDSAEDPAPLPADRLVSWILMNTCGMLGFAHTVQEQRRRGFARLALTELTRRCGRRRMPTIIATGLDNAGMLGAMRSLRFTAVHDVFWAGVTPPRPPPPPAAQPTV